MKIVNNSDEFPTMSNEELAEELRNLDSSFKLAEELNTGTTGIKMIIDRAEQELIDRGINGADVKSRLFE